MVLLLFADVFAGSNLCKSTSFSNNHIKFVSFLIRFNLPINLPKFRLFSRFLFTKKKKKKFISSFKSKIRLTDFQRAVHSDIQFHV
jgi:hypothetical protein